VNRKLIRPTLAEIKEKSREVIHPSKETNGNGQNGQRVNPQPPVSTVPDAAKKRIPPAETYAELFYYKKQIDAHTPMVIVLLDGEEIEGTIEWYDRDALKINRTSAPNILLLKQNIKYMYKAEDRAIDYDGE
jgi:hypothetical protein